MNKSVYCWWRYNKDDDFAKKLAKNVQKMSKKFPKKNKILQKSQPDDHNDVYYDDHDDVYDDGDNEDNDDDD